MMLTQTCGGCRSVELCVHRHARYVRGCTRSEGPHNCWGGLPSKMCFVLWPAAICMEPGNFEGALVKEGGQPGPAAA